MNKLIAAIDLGSSKIAAATAIVRKGEGASLVGLENLTSRGIEEGQIVDMNKVVEDVSSIMRRLESRERKKIKKVWVITRGSDVRLDTSRGMIPLARSSREITERDIKKCLALSAMIRLPQDRAIVQNIIKEFRVDGYSEKVRNPVGLYGVRLEVETFIATASLSKIQNITKCVDHAGFLLEGICLSGIALSECVLRNEEKEKGVLLCDIGDSLTEEFVYRDGILSDTRVIQKGASSVLDSRGRQDRGGLKRLLEEAQNVLNGDSKKFSSVVITGGGSLLDGIIEEAEKIFRIPTRIGLVKSTRYGLNSQDALLHTSTIGLINRIAKTYRESQNQRKPFQKLFQKLLHVYESYF